jgi:hypothetical protein
MVRPGGTQVDKAASSAPVEPAPPSGIEPAPMDLETFLQFSVDDLFYADTDLDRAMDLLAICHREGPGPTAG